MIDAIPLITQLPGEPSALEAEFLLNPAAHGWELSLWMNSSYEWHAVAQRKLQTVMMGILPLQITDAPDQKGAFIENFAVQALFYSAEIRAEHPRLMERRATESGYTRLRLHADQDNREAWNVCRQQGGIPGRTGNPHRTFAPALPADLTVL